jgi:hypothetical protein
MTCSIVKMGLLAALLGLIDGCCTKPVVANLKNDIRRYDYYCQLTTPDLAYVGTDGSIAVRARLVDLGDPESERNGKVRYLLFDRDAVELAAEEHPPALFLNCTKATSGTGLRIPGDLTSPDATEDLLPEPTRQGQRYALTVVPGNLDGWEESFGEHPSPFPYTIKGRTFDVYAGHGTAWRYARGNYKVRGRVVADAFLLPVAVVGDTCMVAAVMGLVCVYHSSGGIGQW